MKTKTIRQPLNCSYYLKTFYETIQTQLKVILEQLIIFVMKFFIV